MIVTVKAWLHADRDYSKMDEHATKFSLHSFEQPLGSRDVTIREITFELFVDDSFNRESILEARRQDILQKKLQKAKQEVSRLESELNLQIAVDGGH